MAKSYEIWVWVPQALSKKFEGAVIGRHIPRHQISTQEFEEILDARNRDDLDYFKRKLFNTIGMPDGPPSNPVP